MKKHMNIIHFKQLSFLVINVLMCTRKNVKFFCLTTFIIRVLR